VATDLEGSVDATATYSMMPCHTTALIACCYDSVVVVLRQQLADMLQVDKHILFA